MRAMKDSGIEWIGEIPEGWKIIRTKIVFSHHKTIVGKKSSEYQRLALTLMGVIPRSKDDSTGLQPEEFNNYQVLEAGNLVFKLIDLENVSTSRVGFSPFTGIVSPAYIILTPTTNTGVKFYYYHFYSMWQREIFNHMGDDGVRSALNSKDLLNIPLPCPPPAEQQRIAAYLDEQCVEIDKVLAKTRESIEEYKKLKQSVITEAVTKGIRPDRPMKPSGIEWIGDIPAEWKTTKTKFCTSKIGSGKTPKGGAENYTDSGIMILRSQNIHNGNLILDNVCHISAEVDEDMVNTRVFADDVLLNITGGSIGRCCIYPSNLSHANVNQHVCIIRTIPKILLPRLMLYIWMSEIGQKSIEVFQTGANREGMNFEQIGNTVIPIMVGQEQLEIVSYLDRQCAEIDRLIAKKEQIISELEGYKKSLIYECVTGKREVAG